VSYVNLMRYSVLLFLCTIAIISYIQRTGINAVKSLVCVNVQIDTEQFGAVGTAWLVGYAIMQVPAGWLADRFGSRNVLCVLAIVWSILTAAIGLCTHLNSLMVLWFVMGLALAGIFPCAAKSIGAWFPDTQKAMASGLLGSSTMLGNAAASLLTVWLVFERGLSWQFTYVLYGLIGVVWAIAYVALIPERTGTFAHAPPMTSADWRRLLNSAPLWLLCGQQFFRAGAMIFFINWFPSFLKEARRFDDYDAGFYASCVSAAALAGGVCGGFFSDWLLAVTGWRRLSRQGIAVFGMTTAGVLVIVTYFLDNDLLAVFLFGAGAFVATFGGVSGYTVAIELGGTRIGVVFSLMNMSGNFAAAFVNYIAGSLTQRTGNWNAALFFIAGIFAVDAFCWSLLNPKEPLFAPGPAPLETGIRPGEPKV
jgi:nitrate/nitrite transporter NarK